MKSKLLNFKTAQDTETHVHVNKTALCRCIKLVSNLQFECLFCFLKFQVYYWFKTEKKQLFTNKTSILVQPHRRPPSWNGVLKGLWDIKYWSTIGLFSFGHRDLSHEQFTLRTSIIWRDKSWIRGTSRRDQILVPATKCFEEMGSSHGGTNGLRD